MKDLNKFFLNNNIDFSILIIITNNFLKYFDNCILKENQNTEQLSIPFGKM